jgi:hypothetical protein
MGLLVVGLKGTIFIKRMRIFINNYQAAHIINKRAIAFSP